MSKRARQIDQTLWLHRRAEELCRFLGVADPSAAEAIAHRLLGTICGRHEAPTSLPDMPLLNLKRMLEDDKQHCAAVGRLDKLWDPSSSLACSLLCGWLRSVPLTGKAVAGAAGSAATLALCDYEGSACIIASFAADATVAPETIDALVVASAWKVVPPNAGVLAAQPYLEFDAPLLVVASSSAAVLGPPTASPTPPSRSFRVDELPAELIRQLSGGARQIHLRGEVSGVSEIYGATESCHGGDEDGMGSPQPHFLVELCSTDDGKRALSAEDTRGGAGCATVVAFVGQHAMRWREALQVGQSYVITHLRQGHLDVHAGARTPAGPRHPHGEGQAPGADGPEPARRSWLGARPILHTSSDAGADLRSCTHVFAWREGASWEATAWRAARAPDALVRSPAGWDRMDGEADAQAGTGSSHSERHVPGDGNHGGARGAARHTTFCYDSLVSQSQHWMGASAACADAASQLGAPPPQQATPQPTAEDDAGDGGGGAALEGHEQLPGPFQLPSPVAPPELINYEGEVTAWVAPSILEVDGAFLAFLCHLPRRDWPGIRVGSQIMLSAVHPLRVPIGEDDATPGVAGFVGGTDHSGAWKLVGFGVCFRGHIRVVQHAPLTKLCTGSLKASQRVAPSASSVRRTSASVLSQLVQQLTLPEFAWCFLTLVQPPRRHVSWSERWRQGKVDEAPLLNPNQSIEALSRLLSAHGFVRHRSLASSQPHASLAPASSSGRSTHGEFLAHGADCRMGCIRAPLPFAPPLAAALAALRSLATVQRAVRDVRARREPMLLMHEDLVLEASGSLGSAALPLLIGMVRPEEELEGSSQEGRTLVLMDSTASVPLLLPHAERPPTPRCCGAWALEVYHLLLEPAHSPSGNPRLHVWSRLHSSRPSWQTPHAHPAAAGGIALSHMPSVLVPTPQLVAKAKSIRQVLAEGAGASPGSAALYARHQARRFDVRCILKERQRRDEPGQAASTVLKLCDEDGAAELTVYVEAGVEMPPGLLPSCTLHIRAMELRTAAASGNTYGRLTVVSQVTAYRCAAHNFDGMDEAAPAPAKPTLVTPAARGAGAVAPNISRSLSAGPVSAQPASNIPHSASAAPLARSGVGTGSCSSDHIHRRCSPAVAATATGVSDGAAAVDSPRLSQASVLSRSTPTMLSELRPYGPPLPGLLKLLVTIKEVYEVHLSLTCCACNQLRNGRTCRCMTARAASLHVEIKVGVTDGTGIATLVAKGKCMWALLQCPSSTIDGIRTAVEACGPLSCKNQGSGYGSRQCLTLAGGLWQCGAGLQISPAYRGVLDAMWPSFARECVVHCGCPSRPSAPTIKSQGVRVSKASIPMLHMHPDEHKTRLTLTATDLMPLAACDMPGELERTLAVGLDTSADDEL